MRRVVVAGGGVAMWLLGVLGLIAIESSYVPQILRLWRRQRADDVSVLFPALNLAGRLLAVAYSVWKGDSVFVWGFLVGASLRATLLTQVLLYRTRARLPARGGHAALVTSAS